MLIGKKYLRFCADKTRTIVTDYERSYPSIVDDQFWRSADELHAVMSARLEKPIFHRRLQVHWRDAKYRSFYVPYPDKYEIYYADQLPPTYLRFYKTKELLQIELWQESLVTTDIAELVRNMILRESPASVDLDLGHPATSDTLGELAAAEFLFPLTRRVACLDSGKYELAQLIKDYQIPGFLIERSLNHVASLKEYF
jgi:hypothetical protein